MQPIDSTLDQSEPGLTPRQDRIETAILASLRAGAPRSTLREHVRSLAQLLRMQGHSAEGAAALIEALARRAAPLMPQSDPSAAGDAPADRLGMMLRWCAAEFSRSD
jgi:hypothetical protein